MLKGGEKEMLREQQNIDDRDDDLEIVTQENGEELDC